jgi:hypothetical protein
MIEGTNDNDDEICVLPFSRPVMERIPGRWNDFYAMMVWDHVRWVTALRVSRGTFNSPTSFKWFRSVTVQRWANDGCGAVGLEEHGRFTFRR